MLITIQDKTFEPFIAEDEISERIAALADALNQDYADKDPLFIVVLNGAFMFASDLIKKVKIPCQVSFIRLSSYSEMRSTGTVSQLLGLQEKLANRHVVIIEDIIDTGNTMSEITQEMLTQNPSSLEIATFLIKPDALEKAVHAKYIGFEIPNRFVLGYGLDYEGYGRNTTALYVLKD
jgi:hypoxanthine phosphoribosyltransferase